MRIDNSIILILTSPFIYKSIRFYKSLIGLNLGTSVFMIIQAST
jgi:hypothetical protein